AARGTRSPDPGKEARAATQTLIANVRTTRNQFDFDGLANHQRRHFGVGGGSMAFAGKALAPLRREHARGDRFRPAGRPAGSCDNSDRGISGSFVSDLRTLPKW